MNKHIIYKYITKLTKNDIYNFSLKQGIELNDKELNILYNSIKNNYKEFLNGKDEELINSLKPKLQEKTYLKVIELYNKYKINIH